MVKKLINLTVLLSGAIIMILSTGCPSSKEEFQGPEGPAPSSLHAYFDGSPWQASSRSATIANGKITITGTASKGQILKMIIDGVATDKYPVGPEYPSVASYAFGSSVFSSLNDPAEGMIEVTGINYTDSLVSGTFYFKLYNDKQQSVSFMEGYFTNIKFN